MGIKRKLKRVKEKIFGKERLFLMEVKREDGSIDYYHFKKRTRTRRISKKEAWKILEEMRKSKEEEGIPSPPKSNPVEIHVKWIKDYE